MKKQWCSRQETAALSLGQSTMQGVSLKKWFSLAATEVHGSAMVISQPANQQRSHHALRLKHPISHYTAAVKYSIHFFLSFFFACIFKCVPKWDHRLWNNGGAEKRERKSAGVLHVVHGKQLAVCECRLAALIMSIITASRCWAADPAANLMSKLSMWAVGGRTAR